MNCYGIPQSARDEFEETIKTTRAENLDLAFRMMGQHPADTDFDPSLEKWPYWIERYDVQA